MNRYADPSRCPDCGSPITPGQPACPDCGLPLLGDTAQLLFTTLSTADRLLAQLRAGASRPAPAEVGRKLPGPVPAGALAASSPDPAAGRTDADRAAGSASRGLRQTSVPAILLGLGAACVLVAGLVFLAVAWSAMGVAGRTATLVVFTLAAGGIAAVLARRGLRAGAEALAVVALGLLTLDLFGARDAGWFGEPSTGAFLLLLGAVVAAAGGAGAVGARHSRVPVLAGAQVVAGAGVGTAVAGISMLPGLETSPALVLAVLAAAAATVGAVRLRLDWARWVCLAVLGVSWLALLGHATGRVDGRAELGAVWLDLQGWPLLAAAVLAGVPALLTTLPTAARVAAASVGAATAFLLVVFPALDEGPTAVAAVAVVGLLLSLAAARLVAAPWSPVGTVTGLATGLVAGALAIDLGATAADRLVRAATTSGTPGGRFDALDRMGLDLASPWMLPVLVATLVAGPVALWSMLPADVTGPPGGGRGRRAIPLATGVLLASVVAMIALFAVPVWAPVAASSAAAAGLLAWWLRSPSTYALVPAAAFLAGAVAVSRYDELLSAPTLSAGVLLLALVHVRASGPGTSAVAGAALVTALAGATWAWASVAGASGSWAALTTLVVLAASAMPVHLLPERTWRHPESSVARVGLEIGAALPALPVAVAGVLAATPAVELTWAAVYLTVAGAAVVAVGLLRPGRRGALPAGGLLLAMASWVRLYEIGVREPEPYTLPAAAVLVALGLYHLRRQPGSGTAAVLSPGLGLALVPSLLWALVEEPGLRALLLGLGCLALVVAGAQLRWTAPLAWGAVAGGVLVTRLAAPYVESTTPTWVLIGAAGALLIVLGVTWEQRLSDARQVVGFVRRLR